MQLLSSLLLQVLRLTPYPIPSTQFFQGGRGLASVKRHGRPFNAGIAALPGQAWVASSRQVGARPFSHGWRYHSLCATTAACAQLLQPVRATGTATQAQTAIWASGTDLQGRGPILRRPCEPRNRPEHGSTPWRPPATSPAPKGRTQRQQTSQYRSESQGHPPVECNGLGPQERSLPRQGLACVLRSD